jgi:hypothetical protein
MGHKKLLPSQCRSISREAIMRYISWGISRVSSASIFKPIWIFGFGCDPVSHSRQIKAALQRGLKLFWAQRRGLCTLILRKK